MRLAVVSDIHGNLAALQAVCADIQTRGVDTVVNLGDSLSGPLLPLETARFLMAQNWIQLAGNHERYLLTLPIEALSAADAYTRSHITALELSWIAALKPSLRFSAEIFICHATPRSDDEYLLETVEPSGVRLATPSEIEERLSGELASVVLCGHTHVARSVRTATDQLILNPGSVGQPAYADPDPYPHAIETGSSDARYGIVEKRGSHWHAELLTVPYDVAPMALLALEQGRHDWVRALRFGYVRE